MSTLLFLLLQGILYISFMVIDIDGGNYELSNLIKFSSIVICYIYIMVCVKSNGRYQLIYLKLALALTVISDLFILLLDEYLYGVLTFIIVQQLYGIRMDIIEKGLVKSNINIRRLLSRIIIQGGITLVVYISFNYLNIKTNILLLATVFYFIGIVTNFIRSLNRAYNNRSDKSIGLFALGMLLFLLCDINVGIFNASEYLDMPNNIYNVLFSLSSILMWAFYAPSQVLISLSSLYNSDSV